MVVDQNAECAFLRERNIANDYFYKYQCDSYPIIGRFITDKSLIWWEYGTVIMFCFCFTWKCVRFNIDMNNWKHIHICTILLSSVMIFESASLHDVTHILKLTLLQLAVQYRMKLACAVLLGLLILYRSVTYISLLPLMLTRNMGRSDIPFCMTLFGALFTVWFSFDLYRTEDEDLYSFIKLSITRQLFPTHVRPCYGIWWYLRIQVFDYYATYFEILFRLQPLLYVAPLLLRLKDSNDNMLKMNLMIAIIIFFDPSTTLTSIVWIMCNIATSHPVVVRRMRSKAWVLAGVVCPAVLTHVMVPLWVRVGNGNANFVFFQGLCMWVFCALGVIELFLAIVSLLSEGRLP